MDVKYKDLHATDNVKYNSFQNCLSAQWGLINQHKVCLRSQLNVFWAPNRGLMLCSAIYKGVFFTQASVLLWPFGLLNSLSTSFQAVGEDTLPVFSCFVSNHNQLTQTLHLAPILKVSGCCHRLPEKWFSGLLDSLQKKRGLSPRKQNFKQSSWDPRVTLCVFI